MDWQQLPDLAVKNLLKFLDSYDRRKIRLVSTHFRDLVDTTEFLKTVEDFPDTEDENTHPFLKHGFHTRFFITNWNFIYENDIAGSPSLRYLTVLTFSATPEQLQFLRQCNSLRAITICLLDLSEESARKVSDLISETGADKDADSLLQIVENLQFLYVKEIRVGFPAGTELEFFGKLLKRAKGLNTLNVPKVLGDLLPVISRDEILQSINYGFIIGPIIKYIARRPHSKTLGNLRTLDMSRFEHSFFELFPELVKVCFKTGTKMENVNCSLIAKLVDVRYDPKLLTVITSVSNKLDGNVEVAKNLVNVRKLSFELEQSNISPYSDEQMLFPLLTELEMDVGTKSLAFEIEVTERLQNLLFKENRQSLKKLTLSCTKYGTAVLLTRLSTLIQKTENLTHLKLKTFLTDQDFTAILKLLKRLQVLEIEDEQGGITDFGICSRSKRNDGQNIDVDIPSYDLLALRDLKKLHLSVQYLSSKTYLPYGHPQWAWSKIHKFSNTPHPNFISDYSFINVLRHLKVKSFLVESADIHVTKLGYLALEGSSLSQTAEYFPLPQYLPSGLSSTEFYRLRSGFKHFSCEASQWSSVQNDRCIIS